jgi:protease-4
MPPPPPGMRGGAMPPPPPGYYPPPMYYPPPPPPQKRQRTSFFDIIGIAVSVTFFFFSLLANIILFAIVAGQSSGDVATKTTTLVDGDAMNKIAVVPVEGVIMSRQAEKFDKILKRIEKDATVKALVVQINTPGGSVTASDAMHHRLEQFKKTTGKKVVVGMTELATSGGYYIAVAGDYVMAAPTTLTGNIGVLLPKYDLSELGDKYGIRDDSLHSTGADFKTVGSMFKKDTPEERAYLVNLIDQAFQQFKDVIVAGRKSATNPLKGNINQIANGKVYTAKEAVQFGLIDEGAAYPEDVYKKAASLAGLSNPSVIRYEAQESLAEMLTSQSLLSPRGQGGNTVNGVNVNLDPELVRELLTPRLMYLWRGQ